MVTASLATLGTLGMLVTICHALLRLSCVAALVMLVTSSHTLSR